MRTNSRPNTFVNIKTNAVKVETKSDTNSQNENSNGINIHRKRNALYSKGILNKVLKTDLSDGKLKGNESNKEGR